MAKDQQELKQAVIALIELVQAASSTDTFSDLFDWHDRTVKKATMEIIEVLFDD